MSLKTYFFLAAESEQSSIWFVLLLCVLLLIWTVFMCSLPMMFKASDNGISFISALGAGLMVGAAFNVVIPESIEDALEKMDAEHTTEGQLAAFRLIGICIASGFAFMMICDSLTHMCSHHSHGHHDHEGHSHPGNVCADADADKKEEDCDHKCEHDHTTENSEIVPKQSFHHSYQSTVWGLCLHSIFDGIAIGASMLAKDTKVLWVIFFAIVLHKSSASFGLGAYFKKLGLTYKQAFWYIMLFASTTPVATFVAALIVKLGVEISETVLPVAFAFSAGTFLYVAITHILPEIGSNLKPSHLLCMFVGVILPYFLFIEHEE
ncbi:hypothetical protein WA158_002520 [Blastocystis sp. Blastoise]